MATSVGRGFSVAVPELGHEEHYWTAQTDGMRSRAEMSRASGPYHSAVVPQIASLSLTFPGELVADLEEAAAALANFDEYTRSVLGADATEIGPMSAILLRTESASSSQIENLTVGARQLAMAEIHEARSANAEIVVANVHATRTAIDLANDLSIETICRMHWVLVKDQRDIGDQAGVLRQELVWVGSSPVTPRGANHIAPQAEQVGPALADLVTFMLREDLPVLAQIAISHAQFETIHPFTDGNGRTGRALVHSLLKTKGLVTRTTVPLSAGLLKETDRYFAALTGYRAGDAGTIIQAFSAAARFGASSGKKLVDDIAAEVSDSKEKLRGMRSDALAWRILPALIANPVVSSAFLVQELGVQQVSVQRALEQLTARGVLHETTGKRRGRVWEHRGLLSVLDAYAQQLRRQ